MAQRGPVGAVAVAAAVGFVLGIVSSLLSGKREPWDAAAYWVLAYPLAILACAFLGHRFPERPWRWAMVLFQAQFVAMCVRNGELGNLWPLGIAMFAVMALPGIAAARLAARFGAA